MNDLIISSFKYIIKNRYIYIYTLSSKSNSFLFYLLKTRNYHYIFFIFFHFYKFFMAITLTLTLQQPIVQTHNSQSLHISPSTVNGNQPSKTTIHPDPTNTVQIVNNTQTSSTLHYDKPAITTTHPPSSLPHSIPAAHTVSTSNPRPVIRRSTRIRTKVQTYNDTYLASIQEGITFSIPHNKIRHQHPIDIYANKYKYIADTSQPGVQGLGCFATRTILRGTTVAYYH